MYLRELSGSKFHSVTCSNVILYNDVKNSSFIKKWIYQVLELSSSILSGVIIFALIVMVSLHIYNETIIITHFYSIHLSE